MQLLQRAAQTCPKCLPGLQHGSHVLMQAVAIPSMKAVSTTAAATPVLVMTSLALPDDGRMQCGRKGQVSNRLSVAVTPLKPCLLCWNAPLNSCIR